MSISIRNKIFSGYLSAIFLMAVIALYGVHVAEGSLKESVGNGSIILAREMLGKMTSNFDHLIESLQLYSCTSMLQGSLSLSNSEFEKIENMDEYLRKRNSEWAGDPADAVTPFMKELIDSPLSNSLRRDFKKFWLEKKGYELFPEIFVTNRFGVNIAQTGRTSDYYQADEIWWKEAEKKGFYLGHALYDESSDASVFPLSVRINDSRNRFAGVIMAYVLVTGLIREAEISVKTHETTELKLICGDMDKLIYSTGLYRFLEDVSGKEFFRNINGEEGFFITEEGGIKKLFSYAKIGFKKNDLWPAWIILLGHDTAEVLGPAIRLKKNIVTGAVILIVIGLVLAYVMSRSITRNLATLAEGAKIIGKGYLSHRVDVNTRDETSVLAAAFNEMAESLQKAEVSLKESRDNLELGVEERTRELAMVNRQLLKEKESLQVAIDEIKILRGILPICSYCKKIRDDDESWQRIEKYIRDHSEAQFSHAICPECAREHYPDINLYDDEE